MNRRRPHKNRARRSGRIHNLPKRVEALLLRHVSKERLRLSRVREAWDQVAPRWVAANTWPYLIRGERLVLNVQDNQWLHELNYWRQELLDRLAESYPELGITQLDAHVGAVLPAASRKGPEPEPPPPPPPAPLCENPPAKTLEALNAISDPALRDAAAAARLMMGRPNWGRPWSEED